MKIIEIEFGLNKKYVDENGFVWNATGELLLDEKNNRITDCYNLRGLLSVDFEEFIDWSKVEVDTPILVSNAGKVWSKRHFAKYENGKVYAFNEGLTSWTQERLSSSAWNRAKFGGAK